MHRRKIKIPTDKLDEEQSQEVMYTQVQDKNSHEINFGKIR